MSKNILSRDEIISLLAKEGNSKDKIGHATTVADISLGISDRLIAAGHKVDKDLLESAALLHDIGYDRTKYKGRDLFPEHIVVGAKRALKMGYPIVVAEAIQGHEAELTKEEGKEIGLPPPVVGDDYCPHCWEAKTVAFADNMSFLLVRLGGRIDPWKDREACAKAVWGGSWKKIYKQRTGREISKDHPAYERTVKLQEEMIVYAKREDYYPWEGMDKIDVDAYVRDLSSI